MPQIKGQRRRKQSKIITLVTDFGFKEPYAGIMKGVILGINPHAVIIDLTHAIPPHDIFEGAFALLEAYKHFPAGTIHIAVVDPGVGGARKNIIIQTPAYIYVAPDNGIASLAVRDEVNECEKLNIYEIVQNEFTSKNISNTFHGRDVFAPAGAHMSKGASPALIGKKIPDYKRLEFPELKKNGDCLEARIIHIDKFGNCITNIDCEYAERIINIRIKNIIISKFCKSYEEGPDRGALAVFGSAGFLEIALKNGNAADAFGIKCFDMIIVDLK